MSMLRLAPLARTRSIGSEAVRMSMAKFCPRLIMEMDALSLSTRTFVLFKAGRSSRKLKALLFSS